MTSPDQPSDAREHLPEPGTVRPEPEGSRWARAHHVLLFLAAAGVVIWVLTGFYTVSANEVAVVERMGQYLPASEPGSGLNFGLPWPIDIVHKVPVGSTRSLVIDEFSNISSSAVEEFKRDIFRSDNIPLPVLDSFFNPYLITADKNMLNATMTINYRIEDAQQYLMGISPPGTVAGETSEDALAPVIRQAAAHALGLAMGAMNVDDALYDNPAELNRRVIAELRQEAKDLRLGIFVTDVAIKVAWPPRVNDAFAAVANARQYAEKAIIEAGIYKAKREADANGQVSALQSQAQGYAKGVTDAASGEKSRFDAILNQAQSAGEITRQSIFSDGMNYILKNMAHIYVVQKGQKIVILLPNVDERPQPANGGNGSANPGNPGKQP